MFEKGWVGGINPGRIRVEDPKFCNLHNEVLALTLGYLTLTINLKLLGLTW